MEKKFNLNGNDVSFKNRFIYDIKTLIVLINSLKGVGKKIVLTSGSFDLLHIGHAQYLEKAKEKGDVLVVGIDDDEKVRNRKGKGRPVVPEDERFKMLAHLRSVDIIVPKKVNSQKFFLLKTIKPDILIISESTNHPKEKIDEMKKYCSEVIMLPPQSTTSTSAKVRLLFTQGAQKFAEKIKKAADELLEDLTKK